MEAWGHCRICFCHLRNVSCSRVPIADLYTAGTLVKLHYKRLVKLANIHFRLVITRCGRFYSLFPVCFE